MTQIEQPEFPNLTQVTSERARMTHPGISPRDLEALIRANQNFAIDLYHYLSQHASGNLFYSPHSISTALAMTYAGARTETAAEVAETLHFILPEPRLHAAFNQLDLKLSQRGVGARGRDDGGFRLHTVNALWGQQGYEFQADFLDALAEHYGAGIRCVDFAHNASAARETINAWVEAQTEGRIADLIPSGALDALTRLVITNAIYFNAAWASPFEAARTRREAFYRLDGRVIETPMMRQTTSLGYARASDAQAVELPYDGHELSMVIVLPDADQFANWEQTLSVDRLNRLVTKLRRQRVALTMPSFETTSKLSLSQALRALGMTTAFSDRADFSGMTGQRNLHISDAIHQAFVSVDEAGTEAAAATAVMVSLAAMMPEKAVELRIDRPFFLLIRDIETGEWLFMGRILDPLH